ncbi:MAG TPA: hypothetical protein VFQ23_18375 [Anaerolineales bacterium]|nr:hypothetical protein [Anaerolineales bacterium]
MDLQSYIPGLVPAEPGPLSRFIPPLEEGVVSAWLSLNVPASTWLLDPFGFSPRLVLEAARAGYRVLVTGNNPITRFLLKMTADPLQESDFTAAMADLSAAKKGEERLSAHLQSLYLTRCEECSLEMEADAFLWRKGEDAPYARIYTCPRCEDSGERPATKEDIDRARKIASTDNLHRSRAFERVVQLEDEDRVFAEEAIEHYLPRPLYVLTTIINRLDSLNLTSERRRALNAILLVAFDSGNTLWSHPAERRRPKQLNIPTQFREHNLWMQLERGLSLWTETASGVPCKAWPERIPESGGICIYEGRLKDLAQEVKKVIPISAVIGSLPRPNQAFWTLSALWSGWLWGREAVEPYKLVLRRRRYDWAWNATALNSAFAHLFELLPVGTRFFGLLSEPEASFLTSALTAASAAGFELQSAALRTEHDPIQLLWRRGEHVKRTMNEASIKTVSDAIYSHLKERGEPASYFHVHAAGMLALTEAHMLKGKDQEFDDALRSTHTLIQRALSEDKRFVHYSTGESVESGFWGSSTVTEQGSEVNRYYESLADRVEIAIVTFLQKNPNSIYLDLEGDLYPRFPGLLTPSKGMIYAVLNSYAEKNGAAWKLRGEDLASARRNELTIITAMIEAVGKRLGYVTRKQEKNYLWEETSTGELTPNLHYAFYILASALIGRAISETPYPPEKTIIVIPGGRAALAEYKKQRDPALAATMQRYQLVKYRLLRAMVEVPVLTRETFEEQIASDPLEKSKSQMMMF